MDGVSFNGSVYSQVNGLYFEEDGHRQAEVPGHLAGMNSTEVVVPPEVGADELPIAIVAGQPEAGATRSPAKFLKMKKPRWCSICKRYFVQLKQHLKTHSERERCFKCSHCNKSFLSKVGLKYHEESHVTLRPYKCNECGKNFCYQKSLDVHLKRHQPGHFLCNFCGKALKNSYTLNVHLRTHTGQKPYGCHICLKTFAYSNVLRDHLAMHAGRRPYPCSICGRAFRQRSAMKKHERLVHTTFKTFQCERCGRKFSCQKYLDSHIKRSHVQRERRYGPCQECGKYFTEKFVFLRHTALHANSRKCDVCKRNFSSDKSLQKHLKIYERSKPIKCGHCGILFHLVTKAREHVKSHILSKISQEEKMGKVKQDRNSNISETKDSVLQIKAVKPFKCGHCSATFDSRKETMDHIIQHIKLNDGSQIKKLNVLKLQRCPENEELKENNDNVATGFQISKERDCDTGSFNQWLNSKTVNAQKITIEIAANGYEESDSDEERSRLDCLGLAQSEDEQVTPKVVVLFNPKTPSNSNSAQLPVDSHAHIVSSAVPTSDANTLETVIALSGTKCENSNVNHGINAEEEELSASLPASSQGDSTIRVDVSKSQNASHISVAAIGVAGLEMKGDDQVELKNSSEKMDEDESGRLERRNDVSESSHFSDIGTEGDMELCDACGAATSNLKHHKQKHRYRASVSCESCGKTMKRKSLYIHRKYHSKAQFTCDICGKNFFTKPRMKEHKLAHSDVKPFQCEVCAKTFKTEKNLSVHSRSHTGERPYDCRFCNKKFRHSNARNDHERTHTGKRPFVCDVCGAGFKQRSALNSHKHVHDKTKRFKCEECGKECSRKITLMRHMRIHENRQNFSCDICEQTLSTPATLARHKLLHGMYTCSRCPRRFNSEQARNEHEKKYDGVEMNTCGICEKSYHTRAVLLRHLKEHTGYVEKKYRCEICKYPFTKHELYQHQLTYYGQKPFFCGHCHRRFHKKDQAMKHILSHVKEGTNKAPHHKTLKAITPMSSGILESRQSLQILLPLH